ncbi:MAG: RtcB family protein [Oscillospiraceae bacterium]|nr:RtcB family protein [Oscillospiraceae bacterium]MBR0162636.1 RtcB family protein [Oscillospiraceae bacterium]
MIEIRGLHNTALCYTPALEPAAELQIKTVCDQEAFAGCKIRIMPDVHAGKGCTIGTTMTIQDKIVPGMVGVDIGCGMETVRLAEKEIDFAALDALIRKEIPCGQNIRKDEHPYNEEINLYQLCCAPYVSIERAKRSIGTLGGGNHFIEVDRGENGELYLVVHSGSRHLGTQVCKYYQDQGRFAMWGGARHQIDELIAEYRTAGRWKDIQSAINELRREHPISIPKDLAYVEGKLFEDYIHDMRITQHFAMLNRKAMTDVILRGMGLTKVEEFTTIHNYIDTEKMILRKGSVSAEAGEKLLIPINMRDGSLICSGKGNEEWNCSAPHGAGRIMSRKQAFAQLSMDEYTAEMEGIWSSCVVSDTLDESPMAYKPIDEIVSEIGPTAYIIERIRPVYNFKAAE